MLRAKFNKNRNFESSLYGSKHWYLDVLLHRENGPAYEYCVEIKHWYLNHKRYNEEEYNAELIKRGIKNNA